MATWMKLLVLCAIIAIVQCCDNDTGPQETPATAESFIESIGVNTHWDYPDTPYGYAYDEVKAKLIYSGIRHIRAPLTDRITDLAQYGIRSLVVSNPPEGSPAQILAKVKSYLTSNYTTIDAIECPNEPDLFWPNQGITYEGQGFPDGAIKFCKDIYTTMKGDPATASLSIYGIALGQTYNPGGGYPNPFAPGLLTDYVDFGNFHPYPGPNPFSYPSPYWVLSKYYWQSSFPSINLDLPWNFALNTYSPPYAPKPMVATETGYSTWVNGLPQYDIHAKYIPRLYLEYFRLGIQRTFTYEFVDEFVDPDRTNREANFGLLFRNVTDKPAFTALTSLIRLLEEKGAPSFTPQNLSISYKVTPVGNLTQTDFVHHILLQKSTGDYYLCYWHEITNQDWSTTPPIELFPPGLPLTVTLTDQRRFKIESYVYDNAWTFQQQPVVENDMREISLLAIDMVSVLHLIPN